MTKDLRITAYHEAGHALAYWLLKRPFESISIIPDDDSNGRTEGTRLPDCWEEAWREIICLYAGPIAADCATGGSQIAEASKDTFCAKQLIHKWFPRDEISQPEADYIGAHFMRYAKDLVQHPSKWAAIEELANELLEHSELSADEVKRVLREAILEAPLKRDLWPGDRWKGLEKDA